MPDFTICIVGSLALIRPSSDQGGQYLSENVAKLAAEFAMLVDPRQLHSLITGLQSKGFTVGGS